VDYLVVDIARTLDESSHGQRASAELAKLWDMAQDELQALRARAAAGDDEAGDRAAALEAQAIQDIERRKDTKRRELLDLVRTIVTAIAAEREVSLVLRADQVLAFSPESEITDEVLGRLDRL
jgi:Skp family chaperone for outer membrane proteins